MALPGIITIAIIAAIIVAGIIWGFKKPSQPTGHGGGTAVPNTEKPDTPHQPDLPHDDGLVKGKNSKELV